MQKKLEQMGWDTLLREIVEKKQDFETSMLGKIFGKK